MELVVALRELHNDDDTIDGARVCSHLSSASADCRQFSMVKRSNNTRWVRDEDVIPVSRNYTLCFAFWKDLGLSVPFGAGTSFPWVVGLRGAVV